MNQLKDERQVNKMSLTIEEVQREQKYLEESVLSAVNSFEQKTKMSVEHIRFLEVESGAGEKQKVEAIITTTLRT
jgi:hypothetical protein